MIRNRNRLINQSIHHSQQVSKLPWAGSGCEVQLLIEIAVIQGSGPAHTDQTSAHHCIEIVRSMRLTQNPLIRLELTLMLQIPCKALNRHVGDCEQMRKRDPMT